MIEISEVLFLKEESENREFRDELLITKEDVEEFIANITGSLGLYGFKSTGKKKSIKTLFSKLEDRKEKLGTVQEQNYQYDVGILFLVKKGKKILDKLT